MDTQDLFNQSRGSEEKPKQQSPLVSLERDLKFFNDSIREVAVDIMTEGISATPIFVAHQHDVKLGEVILDRNELNTEWSIHASTIEEFIERGIIKKELKERFLTSYKNPNDFMCLFVVVPEGANFVYYPYVKG